MDFQAFLKDSSEKIRKTLDKSSRNLASKTDSEVSLIIPELNQFLKTVGAGKMLRGALVCLGCLIPGGKITPKVLNVAAAVEVIHASLLAHDDIIDKSKRRRGNPSLWKALGGKHYGISQTICLGDLGFFWALQVIANSKVEGKTINAVLAEYSQALVDTALGQMMDVKLPLQKKVTLKEIVKIYKLKTAAYTISAPLAIGTILGQQKKDIQIIRKFGENLGIAYQIQDDILGVFGDEKTLGKSIKSDIEEGKCTILYAFAKKNCKKEQQTVLHSLYGKGHITDNNLEIIKKFFIETGALDYAQQEADKYLQAARELIPQICTSPKGQLLDQLCNYLTKRKT